MGNFRQDRGKRFGGGHGGGFGRRDGGRGGFGGGRDRGLVTMHQAICAQCGKSCEVPFRPTGDKPVYCNVCFGGRKEGGSRSGGDRFPQKIAGGEMKGQFDILNAKLDRIIRTLEEKKEAKEIIVKKNKTAGAVKKKKTKK